MDPPILVLWQSWLLLNSGSGKEEEQVKEPDTQRKDLPDKKNLKIDVAEILILLDADLTSSGICSVFEVADLDLDAGGRPLLGREGP